MQLGLGAYVKGSGVEELERVRVAGGLAPEPFMLDLRTGGVLVESWLGSVLVGRPNAGHHALAQLAHAGAVVWTVNFDRLIEQAAPDLEVVAWPADPVRGGQLLKPHGTLGGELIVAADQVLRGLDGGWRRRLERDVRDRTVVFLGYSGRDLDFQPLWDEVLVGAREVLWFEQPDAERIGHVQDEARRRLLLRAVDARGALRLLPAGPPPADLPGASGPNATADFVAWCVERSLVTVDKALFRKLYEPVPALQCPRLPGELDRARAAVLGHLGDLKAAQAQRRALLRRRGARQEAARALLSASITHGTGPGRLLLLGARALPPIGRLEALRTGAERKRLTALHRQARHEAVLRATSRLDDSAVSTLLILRASALRLLDSLDEAVTVADEALRRARREDHAVRSAHAAFQKALALLWAERVEEAKRTNDDELRPLASLAANRWVAWAHFIDGGLAVRLGEPDKALASLDLSENLFRAEALFDGVVSVRLARLTVRRLAGDDEAFRNDVRNLLSAPKERGRGWRWYAESSDITRLALELERAELERRDGTGEAQARYEGLAGCGFPLYACMGRLGLAMGSVGERRVEQARKAQLLADRVCSRLLQARSRAILEGLPDADRELFFC
ncbi:MAG TPA: SIR2 family protein [Thermoleophilaceae bacterium]|nr:SIR2 family protein [Thermoleophilaceae bacterium]